MWLFDVKDPFSLESVYVPDSDTPREYVDELNNLSRARYARSLWEAKKVVETEQQDIVKKIDSFSEPLL